MKVVFVGAGASGIVGAISYKRNHPNDDVLIIEHLDAPLKKLLATGNGKCNLANTKLDINKYSHPEFVKDILKEYDYESFFDSVSVKTKAMGELVYPVSETAVSVRNALIRETERLGIKINCSEKFLDYKKVNNYIEVITDKDKYVVEKLYLAGSLCSTKNLGSDGSVLSILKNHGYKIKEPLPGLCPIVTKENTKLLDGTRIKSEVSLYQNSKLIHKEKGEVLFKKNGLSGIAIFNVSALIARSQNKSNKIVLDLLPEYSETELEKYWQIHSFDGFLQAFLHPTIIKYLKERFSTNEEIFRAVKHLEFTFKEAYGFEFAQVSVGGVDLSMVNKHLESVKEKDVYLLGELLDIDGPCGGYNLTWAFGSAIGATK